jgi:hypothetical protein
VDVETDGEIGTVYSHAPMVLEEESMRTGEEIWRVPAKGAEEVGE